MGRLIETVWVKPEVGNEYVAFGPDSDEIPEWALDQMGDHCFEDGERPSAAKAPAKKAAKAPAKKADDQPPADPPAGAGSE